MELINDRVNAFNKDHVMLDFWLDLGQNNSGVQMYFSQIAGEYSPNEIQILVLNSDKKKIDFFPTYDPAELMSVDIDNLKPTDDALTLQGGVPAWNMTAAQVRKVQQYIIASDL